LKLTTRGRKSGQPRTVTIWFVDDGPGTYLVQHQSPRPAQWYRNLLADRNVQIDLGKGVQSAVAEPITDRAAIDEVLAKVRSKYMSAWLFRLLGWGRNAVAARIRAGAPAVR
jgi:deazaflavin-dependent oxidoreductase (nitroreductase family)